MSTTTTTDQVQIFSDSETTPASVGDVAEDLEQRNSTKDMQLEGNEHVEREKDESIAEVKEQVTIPESSRPFQMEPAKARTESTEKKRDLEKLGIYKALAIKLKKELVKTRDELQKLRDDYEMVVGKLQSKVENLEKTLESERVLHENTNLTLEATCRNLKSQLEIAENDLNSLQAEFDSYKIRATKIMQQNNLSVASSNRTFDEDRYKQMRALNDEQKHQITSLNSQIEVLTTKNKDLELQIESSKKDVGKTQIQVDELNNAQSKCKSLIKENESLKQALREFKERHQRDNNLAERQTASDNNHKQHKHNTEQKPAVETLQKTDAKPHVDLDRFINDQKGDIQISPGSSVKDENQMNSSPSSDSSSYGYVHIKPTAFEIISRTSVLEDAQNQIDNLTKAYLDSESTNSLLSEQVSALKEEIRRIQRGNERIELANNLEYLKNVIFKYLSLDNSQMEQKQRLIPVLSTVLKLSPDETQKLNSLALTEKGGMTSSFFKL